MKRVLLFLLLLLGVFSSVTESMAQVPGLPNRWNSISMANIDTGLVGPATFTVGGKTYMVGGDTSEFFGAYSRLTRQVWVYTHATNSWSQTTPFPGDLRMGAVAFGATSTGKGYYGLGYDNTGYPDTAYRYKYYDTLGMPQFYDTLPYHHVRFLKDFWQFDTATSAWTRLKNFPIPDIPAQDTFPDPMIENGIANATGFSIDTVVTINGNLTKNFAGGFIFGEYLEIFWDSLKGTATPMGYGDPTWDGSVGIRFIKKPYFYDAALDSFFPGPDIPGPGRSNAAAMVLDGKQTVVGRNPRLYAGLGDNDAYNILVLNIHLKDWYSYDFATNQWKTERVLPDTGKSNVGTFGYEHVGFVTCGYDGEWRKTFFQYNTDDEDWIRYPDYRDSGRSLGSSFIHGNRGHYGAGFRGNSQELKTFSWYNIDTNTIRLYPHFNAGEQFCAGDSLSFYWYSAINFNPGSKMVVQISDKDGIFEYPITANSNMDTFDIVGQGDTIKAKIPHQTVRGSGYKIRILSTSPFYISRLTHEFRVKENPKFKYYPKTHPPIDTVCIHSDHFIPSQVSGEELPFVGGFTYTWLKNGAPVSPAQQDTLFFKQIGYADSGAYRLVALGGCYSDTSNTFYVFIDSVPPPTFIDNLDYPGMVGNDLFICEFDTSTFYVVGSGKNISYRWYHNDDPLDSRMNTAGLGGPVIRNSSWNMIDSGRYTIRLVESCGAYTISDTIHVRMRDIPRIKVEPTTLDSAYLEGHTVIFQIKATGYDLKYQWKKETIDLFDDGRIFGSLTDSLTITNLGPEDVAFYRCEVTGGCPPKAFSNLATMDLNASPVIIKEPNDTLELCEGASNVITIIAQGTNLRYKWRYANFPYDLDTVHFLGQDTRVLTVVDAQLFHSGYIVCEVDNSAGATVISKTCYLRVKPMPPADTITKVGNLLMAKTVCANAKYQWFMNGVWKGQYSTRIIQPTEEGDYTVRVICDDCPAPISDPFYFLTSIVSANLESLDMYPNPTQGKVMLDLPGIHAENPATVRIYDLSGKLVKTIENIETSSYQVELDSLSKGMYIVHVSSEEVSFSGKLVKE